MTEDDRTAHLDLTEIQGRLRAFAAARDWEQFHSPKNLAMALAAESGELLEIFQWLTEAQSNNLEEDVRAHAAEELADIQIYLIRIADILDIPLPNALAAKMQENELRYPVEESKGRATKYSDRGRPSAPL